MMKLRLFFTILAFLISSSAIAQQWVNDYLDEVGFGNPDKIVNHFLNEMRNETGNKPPDLEFITISEGQKHTLKSFQGTETIVLFWKTNCSGSTMQLSELSSLLETSTQRDIQVLYLSPNSRSDINNFKKEGDYNGFFGQVDINKLKRPFQLFATPSVYVIDEQGTIMTVWIKPKSLVDLKKNLNSIK